MSIETHHVNSDAPLNDNRKKTGNKLTAENRAFRIIGIKAIIPKKMKSNSINELQFMLVSLRNAISVCSVHVSKIEREIHTRNSHSNAVKEVEGKVLFLDGK